MRTLLIVDDNPQVRVLIKRLVAEPDDIFYECGNGAEALAAYQECQPDWVLMDVDMPVMNGLVATSLLKSEDPAARVVIVTQHNNTLIRAKAHKAGAYAFILKDDLLALRNLLVAA